MLASILPPVALVAASGIFLGMRRIWLGARDPGPEPAGSAPGAGAAEWGFGAAIVVVAGLLLAGMGRTLWCACGSPHPWSAEVWSRHNSQHLGDAYTFSHVLHGVIFYWLLLIGPARRWSLGARMLLGLTAESAWEVFENTPWVINRYREATASLDYFGDSVFNSLGDIAACAAGFALAARIPARWVVAASVATEIVMLLWIRDNLTLNVLMLIHPIEALKAWQMGGMP